MHEIGFTIEPSNASNDDQVRILIDRKDLIAQLDEAMLGIDPPEFFAAPALSQAGELLFARCDCGVVGCGDATVETSRDEAIVRSADFFPEIFPIKSLTFSRRQFDAAVEAAKNDHDWETPERTAERLIADLDFSALDDQGLAFCWASGRLDGNKISVCFDLRSKYQVIAHAPWDHGNPESALTAIRSELEKTPQQWSDVVYRPKGADLQPPPFCGPGWKRA